MALQSSGRLKTSITVMPDIWKRFDKRCTDLDLSLGRGIDEALAMWLKEERPEPTRPEHLEKLFKLIEERITTPEKSDALTGLLKNALKLCEGTQEH